MATTAGQLLGSFIVALIVSHITYCAFPPQVMSRWRPP